jgi:hypothetical protein
MREASPFGDAAERVVHCPVQMCEEGDNLLPPSLILRT